MPVTEQGHSTSRRGVRWLLYVTLALVMYGLSIGPSSVLEDQGFIPEDFLDPVYAPVSWAMNHSRPVSIAVNAYIEWWIALCRKKQPASDLLP